MRRSDPMFDQMLSCCDGPDREYRTPIPTTHWKTRDGRVLLIKGMEDGHLRNTVLMLRRKGIRHDALELEAFRRGILEPEAHHV